MVRFFNKKNGSPLDKRNALDGLLGKLDSQLNSEQRRATKFLTRGSSLDPLSSPLRSSGSRSSPLPTGINILGKRGAGKSFTSQLPNPFQQLTPMKPTNPAQKPKLDPKTLKSRVSVNRRRMINAKRANVLARHRGGNYSTTTDDPDEYVGGVEAEFDDEDDLKVVDEGSYKTMEWTEPDGSITILKFDEDGALIGKEKASEKSKKKTRPSKFQQDLKAKLEREEEKFKKERLRSHKNWKAKALQAQALNNRQQRAVTSGQIASGSPLRPQITRQQASAITQQQARERSLRQGIVGGE